MATSLSTTNAKWWNEPSLSLVGQRVAILWNTITGTHYTGTVEAYLPNGKHRVRFDDGDLRDYQMHRKSFNLLRHGTDQPIKRYERLLPPSSRVGTNHGHAPSPDTVSSSTTADSPVKRARAETTTSPPTTDGQDEPDSRTKRARVDVTIDDDGAPPTDDGAESTQPAPNTHTAPSVVPDRDAEQPTRPSDGVAMDVLRRYNADLRTRVARLELRLHHSDEAAARIAKFLHVIEQSLEGPLRIAKCMVEIKRNAVPLHDVLLRAPAIQEILRKHPDAHPPVVEMAEGSGLSALCAPHVSRLSAAFQELEHLSITSRGVEVCAEQAVISVLEQVRNKIRQSTGKGADVAAPSHDDADKLAPSVASSTASTASADAPASSPPPVAAASTKNPAKRREQPIPPGKLVHLQQLLQQHQQPQKQQQQQQQPPSLSQQPPQQQAQIRLATDSAGRTCAAL